MKRPEIVSRLREIIQREAPTAKVYLYGSEARGDARADSIPGLEIMANDVRCTHAATIGKLEEEPIFYLMSRGMTRADAERLLVVGFFDPIMERIPFPEVRTRLGEHIEQKLAGAVETVR